MTEKFNKTPKNKNISKINQLSNQLDEIFSEEGVQAPNDFSLTYVLAFYKINKKFPNKKHLIAIKNEFLNNPEKTIEKVKAVLENKEQHLEEETLDKVLSIGTKIKFADFDILIDFEGILLIILAIGIITIGRAYTIFIDIPISILCFIWGYFHFFKTMKREQKEKQQRNNCILVYNIRSVALCALILHTTVLILVFTKYYQIFQILTNILS